jgi:hypothetical protein
MSGFGIRAFKKLKEESVKKEETLYTKYVVFGDNYLAAYSAMVLSEKHGKENVCLISINTIDKQQISNEWKCSINTLRSDDEASLLQGNFAKLDIIKQDSPVLFYKDTKFHKFGGRAKPFPLLEDEEYFSRPFYKINLHSLFSTEQWNGLDELLAEITKIKIIKEIEKVDSTDLVNVTNFRLKTGESENIDCENLYFCESPKELFSLTKNKNDLSDELVNFCSRIESRVSLTVNFECEGEVVKEAGTVFLPQSATHEWGHYIIDFNQFDPSTEKQSFNSMMFIDLDEVNEEELAKKIKHMKRVIERVYPEFSKMRYTEHIHYNSEFLLKGFPEASGLNCQGLNFVGVGANTDKVSPESLFIGRSLFSLPQ